MSHIFSVSEITDSIKRTLEGGFPFIWVKGQVTNVSRPSSGHLYFSLRDANALLSCVWFKGNQRGEERFDPLTGEVFEEGPRPGIAKTLCDGQELLVAGRLNVYPPRGNYQLLVEVVQEAGLGTLFLQFEQRKRELEAKGYFASERKRELPKHPRRVAVITAPGGAAIQDFIRIANERGLGADIRLYPAPVQGDDAPPKLVEAVRKVCDEAWAEVLVLIRGGGSLEDLWAFNDDALAQAIFESSVPVLAGIGHEVDHTIADMTADVRAATPTHAAQLLWQERGVLMQAVDEYEMRLTRSWQQAMEKREAHVAALTKGLSWLSPEKRIDRWEGAFTDLGLRMQRAWGQYAERLDDALYRITMRAAAACGPDALQDRFRTTEVLFERLRRAGEQQLQKQEHLVERTTLQLEGLNPHLPLERGYSLVRLQDGTFLRSAGSVRKGDRLDVVVQDGSVQVTVESFLQDADSKDS